MTKEQITAAARIYKENAEQLQMHRYSNEFAWAEDDYKAGAEWAMKEMEKGKEWWQDALIKDYAAYKGDKMSFDEFTDKWL